MILRELVTRAVGCPKTHFFYKLAIFWSAKKRRKDTFFPHPLSTVIFATATVLAFVLLRGSRFNFHCYTQREATPTQKLARKCAATSRDFLRERLQSAFTLANQLRWIAQYVSCDTFWLSLSKVVVIDWWSLIQRYPPLFWADSLRSHVVLHEWLAFYSALFIYFIFIF